VFSADAGQAALDRLSNDDPDPNGVFTRNFLPLLRQNITLLDAIKAAQASVVAAARNIGYDQRPAFYDGTIGDSACLTDSCRSGAGNDEALWQILAGSQDPALFRAFVERFPQSPHAAEARARAAVSDESATVAALGATDRMPNVDGTIPSETTVPSLTLSADATNAWGQVSLTLGGNMRPDEGQVLQGFLDRFPADPHVGRVLAELGGLYQTGKGGVAVDQLMAVALYRRSADLRDPAGLYRLGAAYRDRIGGLSGDDLATAYFQQAQAFGGGGDQAVVDLGASTQGVGDLPQTTRTRDMATQAAGHDTVAAPGNAEAPSTPPPPLDDAAAALVRKLAAGDASAALALGQRYEMGQGVAQDLVTAYTLYYIAAMGNADGRSHMNSLASKLSYAEVIRAVQQAHAFRPSN